MKMTKRIKPLNMCCKLNKDSYLRNKARHHKSIKKIAGYNSECMTIINKGFYGKHRPAYRKYLVAGDKNNMTRVELSIKESERYIVPISRIPFVLEKRRRFANTGVRYTYLRSKYN